MDMDHRHQGGTLRIFVHRDDGTEVDVTDGVLLCLELLTDTTQWSGNGQVAGIPLDVVEEVPVIKSLRKSAGLSPKTYMLDPCTCGHACVSHREWDRGKNPYYLGDRGCTVATGSDTQCPCEAFILGDPE